MTATPAAAVEQRQSGAVAERRLPEPWEADDDDTMTVAEVAEWRRMRGGAADAARYERVTCVVLEPGTLRFLGAAVLVRRVTK